MHIIKTNCPRDCYDGCGILARVESGKPPRLSGDPDHPVSRGSLCAKCGVAYNGVFQDDTARLGTPLRRLGRVGSGRFEPISWEEALATIAGRLNGIIERSGADAILTLKYTGTLSLLAFFFPDRWVNRVGAAVCDYGTICNAAGLVAWDYLFGSAVKGFDPRTARDADCIVVWGANPAHTAPHMQQHWLADSPARVVVIDPVRTASADAADLHLQPRPGTDAALAFALLHSLRAQGGFDEEFIARHTVGYEEIVADIDRCTPQWAAGITGIPASDIEAAASLYGAGPSLLWCGQGLQRQPGGGNVMRAAGLLPTLTGNVGKPGSGFYYLNESVEFAGADLDYLSGASLANGPAKTVTALDLGRRLADPTEFHALLVWNANPLASCADQQTLRSALAREDLFKVVIDLFHTDTAQYADIVLPAASFLEFDDITYSYMNLIVGAQSKVCDPPGTALPNQEIFRRLAAAMDLDDPALLESDAAILGTVLDQCGQDYDFAGLKERGFFSVGGDEPVMLYGDLSFDTPSGRIEIASERAALDGHSRVPSPAFDSPPSPGTLRLLTPASNWRMNDTYGNDPRLRKRAGEAAIHLHHEDARQLGITDGDRVRVSSDRDALELIARVGDRVEPGSALSYKGRWPSLENGGKNLNTLYAGLGTDLGDSSGVHGLTVKIEPLSNSA